MMLNLKQIDLLKKKKYLVGGLGVTGRALCQFLQAYKADFCGFEESSRENFEKLSVEFPEMKDRLYFEKLPDEILKSINEILVSPGVPLCREWIVQARNQKIPVVGELEFASRYLSGFNIGVTGTNGKSTTVSLLAEMLNEGSIKASLKGNIGDPLIAAVEEPPQDVYVIEMSSYQLETIDTFHPKVAVVLNVTDDHLDRYASRKEYADAKERITMNQTKEDCFIYNADDYACVQMAKRSRAHLLPFSLVQILSEGGSIHDEQFKIVAKGREWNIPISKALIKGLHNQENILASLLAANVCGLNEDVVTKVLERFSGLHHRMEDVGQYGGIQFYDDSKGTNVGSVVMSLASVQAPVILLMGGKSKQGDYSPLDGLVKGKVKELIVFGEAAEEIMDHFSKQVSSHRVKNMSEAVALSYKLAHAGDTVLLSPACSSFDQYANYVERGLDFQNCVKRGGIH